MLKIFKIINDETFWIVAETEEQAIRSMKEDYNEEMEEGYQIQEVSREIHFNIKDEETGGEIDIWDMLEEDLSLGVEIPYMIATTLY